MFVKMHIKKKAMPLAVMMVLAVVMLAFPATTFAAEDDNHIVITGDAQDFFIESGGTTLFDIEKILPGENAKYSDITIRNTQSLPYTLSIGVEDVGSYSDLLDILDIVVRLDGNIIADFPAKGQIGGAGYQNAYPFGRIQPGVTAVIEVGLRFANGATAGNDLQEKSVHLVWRLTAISDQPPEPVTPGTPGNPGTGNPSDAVGAFGTPAGAADVAATDTTPQDLPDLVNIDNTETPTATNEGDGVVPTGSGAAAWALANLLLTILAALLMIFLLVRYIRARGQDDEYSEASADGTGTDTYLDKRLGRKITAWILSVAATIAAVVLFLLTENLQLPMEFVNSYTLWYVALVLVELLVFAFSVSKHKQYRNAGADA